MEMLTNRAEAKQGQDKQTDADQMGHELESSLADLLSELTSVQTELLEVLSEKRARMAANDVPGMQELQPREEALAERLQCCYEQRQQLLQNARGQGLRIDNLSGLASLMDGSSSGDMRKQVKQASSRMRLLQHQSLTNWVVAQKTLLHLSQMLEIIATGGRLQPTYGKDRLNSCGALVDREA